jgi:hypothetical protein
VFSEFVQLVNNVPSPPFLAIFIAREHYRYSPHFHFTFSEFRKRENEHRLFVDVTAPRSDRRFVERNFTTEAGSSQSAQLSCLLNGANAQMTET